MFRASVAALSLFSLSFSSSACSGGGANASGAGPGRGSLSIEVTDDPFDHGMVSEAKVRVDLVRLHGSGSEDSGWQTVFEGGPLELDLLELRNGVTRVLVQSAELPAGTYRKLRLRVASGVLVLTNGNTYTTADGSLHLTSTGTSGFKLDFEPAFEIRDGFSSSMLLDFDLTKVFKPVPASDALNATTYQLHPGIRVANLSTSGELRGVITTDDGATLVEAASVYVLPAGASDLDDAVASTSSDANGSWAVLGLDVGVYDVLARSGELSAVASGQVVGAGAATLVDLDLE